MQKKREKVGRPGKNLTHREVVLRQQCSALANLADKLGKAKEALEGEVSEVLETLWNGQLETQRKMNAMQRKIDVINQHLGIEEGDDGTDDEDDKTKGPNGGPDILQPADDEGGPSGVCAGAPSGEQNEVPSAEEGATEEESNPG